MPRYVYPGTFSPPTYGHLHVVETAANLLGILTIICSTNPIKNSVWFPAETCKGLWRWGYDLPLGVDVCTLTELRGQIRDFSKVVVVRGVRNGSDIIHEGGIVDLNDKVYGIKNYHILVSDKDHRHISSTLARQAAENLDFEALSTLVAPLVVTALLEKVLKIRNLVLVVGRPASGKTTVLKKLVELDRRNVHIRTDDFNHKLNSFLKEYFGEEDLTKIAVTREDELTKVIAPKWLGLLADALRNVPEGSNVFVEAAYGLQNSKPLYRYIGGKILSIGCRDEKVNNQRLDIRGTPHHKIFTHKIPGLEESRKIARDKRLQVETLETDGSIGETYERVEDLNQSLNQGGLDGLGQDIWSLDLP